MSSRLLRLLNEPGAVLDRDGDAWIVRLGPDRRRKPAMRLTEAQMLGGLDGQSLTRTSDGSWRLAVAEPTPEPAFRRAARVSPLSHLVRSGFVEKRHVAALEAFNRDQTAGFVQTGLTSNWEAYGTVGGGRTGTDDAQVWRLKARDHARRALEALGPLRPVFEAVCLNERPLAAIERELRLAKGEGRRKVRDALERLAVFYSV